MTEATKEQRNWLRYELTSFREVVGKGSDEWEEIALAALADAERLAELERIAETGTAENFLSCDDDTKRLMFANHVQESERRKRAEDRLAEVEAVLREEIGNALNAAENANSGVGAKVPLEHIFEHFAERLQRILDGDEKDE